MCMYVCAVRVCECVRMCAHADLFSVRRVPERAVGYQVMHAALYLRFLAVAEGARQTRASPVPPAGTEGLPSAEEERRQKRRPQAEERGRKEQLRPQEEMGVSEEEGDEKEGGKRGTLQCRCREGRG